MDECRGRQDAGSGLLQRKRIPDYVTDKLEATFRVIRTGMHLVIPGKSGVPPRQERVREFHGNRLVFYQIIQHGMAQLLDQQVCRNRRQNTESARLGERTVGYKGMDVTRSPNVWTNKMKPGFPQGALSLSASFNSLATIRQNAPSR